MAEVLSELRFEEENKIAKRETVIRINALNYQCKKETKEKLEIYRKYNEKIREFRHISWKIIEKKVKIYRITYL